MYKAGRYVALQQRNQNSNTYNYNAQKPVHTHVEEKKIPAGTNFFTVLVFELWLISVLLVSTAESWY